MMMKNIVLAAMVTFGVMMTPAAYAAGGTYSDDIKYELKDWGQELLDIYERAPKALSKDLVLDIKPFPTNSSGETATELLAMKKFEADERTPQQVEKILQEHSLMPLYQVFSANKLYDFDAHPETNALLGVVDADVSYFILREKMKFQRARPTQLMPQLTTVIKVPSHSAYPSGHAGQSYAAALVLGEVDPAHKAQYLRLAIDVAHRREIAGLHYPSDSDAGRDVAKQVVKALFENADIQKRVEAAKKEFAGWYERR